MTDVDARGSMWITNIHATIALIEANSKDNQKIYESFKNNGFLVKPEDNFSKTVESLKQLRWIKETKDAYILTEKGKKEVENYESLRKRGFI